MNQDLANTIMSLPFFDGKKVTHNAESLAIHFRIDDDINMMFLPALPGENKQSPAYSLYLSNDGVIKMDNDNDRIVIIYEANDGATVEKSFTLSTYNLEKHKQSSSVLSYDIVTVLNAINEIIAFNAGE